MARIKYKEAVGLQVKKGKSAIGNRPSKSELKQLYIREARSVRNIAKVLNCSKDMIYRALQQYGIPRRSNTEKRSQLQEHSLSFLNREIREKGFNQVAKELGVHNTTLRRYLEKRKSQG